MVVIKLMGGLGNQLQQYALYQKFISLGKDAYLDTAWFNDANQENMLAPRQLELNLFKNADYNVASTEQISGVLGKETTINKICKKMHLIKNKHIYESQMYDASLFEKDNIYLEGHWAAEKYYAGILPVIREKLNFDKDDISEDNKRIAQEILSKSHLMGDSQYTCSVHIRRGDYLDPENIAMFGGIATEKYYDSAFSYIREKYPDTEFYIFTDDKEYVKDRYGMDNKCHLVDINHGLDSRYDIYLMSLCDAHICANSTFSFWGARLDEDWNPATQNSNNEVINIRPTIHANTQVFVPEEMHDLWKGWILIDPEGNVR